MRYLIALFPLLIALGLPAQTPIAPGDPVTGRLERGDSFLSTDEHFDEHTFEGEAGQMISARMRSDDFDTYLIFIGADGLQQDNDDFAGELNSGIDLTLTASGTQRLLATSYSPDASGEYTLVVHTGALRLAQEP
jgi:hypothetical protein